MRNVAEQIFAKYLGWSDLNRYRAKVDKVYITVLAHNKSEFLTRRARNDFSPEIFTLSRYI